jgi:CRP/FNR family transcriptional regulator
MQTGQLFQAIRYITPDISETELQDLVPLLTGSTLKRGDFLVRAGELSTHINFIVKGAGRMYYVDGNGHESNVLLVIENGFLHDYESLILNKPTRFYCQVTEESEIIHIDYRLFDQLLNSTKNWEHCGRMINQYVMIETFRRVHEYLFDTPEQLYLKILETAPYLIDRFSQEHLASYIGVKRESLSRIKNRVTKRKRL